MSVQPIKPDVSSYSPVWETAVKASEITRLDNQIQTVIQDLGHLHDQINISHNKHLDSEINLHELKNKEKTFWSNENRFVKWILDSDFLSSFFSAISTKFNSKKEEINKIILEEEEEIQHIEEFHHEELEGIEKYERLIHEYEQLFIVQVELNQELLETQKKQKEDVASLTEELDKITKEFDRRTEEFDKQTAELKKMQEEGMQRRTELLKEQEALAGELLLSTKKLEEGNVQVIEEPMTESVEVQEKLEEVNTEVVEEPVKELVQEKPKEAIESPVRGQRSYADAFKEGGSPKPPQSLAVQQPVVPIRSYAQAALAPNLARNLVVKLFGGEENFRKLPAVNSLNIQKLEQEYEKILSDAESSGGIPLPKYMFLSGVLSQPENKSLLNAPIMRYGDNIVIVDEDGLRRSVQFLYKAEGDNNWSAEGPLIQAPDWIKDGKVNPDDNKKVEELIKKVQDKEMKSRENVK